MTKERIEEVEEEVVKTLLAILENTSSEDRLQASDQLISLCDSSHYRNLPSFN